MSLPNFGDIDFEKELKYFPIEDTMSNFMDEIFRKKSSNQNTSYRLRDLPYENRVICLQNFVTLLCKCSENF